MKRIKLAIKKHFPHTYQFLYTSKHKVKATLQGVKPNHFINKLRVRRRIKRLVFNKVMSKHIAVLDLDGKFNRALEPTAHRLNKRCDTSLIVMLVVSALRIDPRVERAARALASNGYRVVVICPDLSVPPLKDLPLDWGMNIEFDVVDLPAANFVNIHPWLQGEIMLQAALAYQPLAFHCHDLNTAVIGLAAARQLGVRCVCDFHEWYSENVSWDVKDNRWIPHPHEKRELFQAAEALVMARADDIITVCDSIAKELEVQHLEYNRKINVIRNIPSLSISDTQFPSLREQLNVSPEHTILLWQGGTGPTRMLEPIIQSLAYAKNIVLVIRGPSLDLFGEGYLQEARQAGVVHRFHLLPPVKSADVVNAAYGADAGLWTLPNFCKNFYFALPNKVFEYLAAGLPIVCADFPEVRALIDKYKVGTVFDPYEPKSIAEALIKITDAEFREKCRQNTAAAILDMDANKEWNKLVKLYDELRAQE